MQWSSVSLETRLLNTKILCHLIFKGGIIFTFLSSTSLCTSAATHSHLIVHEHIFAIFWDEVFSIFLWLFKRMFFYVSASCFSWKQHIKSSNNLPFFFHVVFIQDVSYHGFKQLNICFFLFWWGVCCFKWFLLLYDHSVFVVLFRHLFTQNCQIDFSLFTSASLTFRILWNSPGSFL